MRLAVITLPWRLPEIRCALRKLGPSEPTSQVVGGEPNELIVDDLILMSENQLGGHKMLVSLTPDFLATQLVCPPGKTRFEFVDKDGVKGLYVECRPKSPGEGTYYFRYKDAHGKTCHQRLGGTRDMPLAEARAAAKKLKARITLGADPRAEARARKAIPTYSEFFEQKYLPFVAIRKRSFKDDRRIYELRVKAAIGNLRLNQITRERIQALHSSVLEEGRAPATANHVVRLIRRTLNLSVEWGLLEKSPASKIKLFHEDNIVNNVPDDAQLERLLEELRTNPNRTVCQLALLALNSAARLSELLKLKWSDCDLDKRVITIRAANSKSKRLRNVPINTVAMEVLQSQWTRGVHEYVFVNRKTDKPYTYIRKAWERIRERAGLPRLRFHDLRHAACTYMSADGIELWTIATIAGHSDPKITTRYSHVPSTALANAMDVVSKKTSSERTYTAMAESARLNGGAKPAA